MTDDERQQQRARYGIPSDNLSVEQMCRDLLDQAIDDKLVALRSREWYDPDPQARSSGELVGMANLLNKFLADRPVAEEKRNNS